MAKLELQLQPGPYGGFVDLVLRRQQWRCLLQEEEGLIGKLHGALRCMLKVAVKQATFYGAVLVVRFHFRDDTGSQTRLQSGQKKFWFAWSTETKNRAGPENAHVSYGTNGLSVII